MQQALIVGVFGGVGSMLRFGLGQALKDTRLSHPTVLINVLGSFIIGIVSMLPIGDFWRTAIMVGLLGGFTTFSAFSLETVDLIQKGLAGSAALYVGSSVFCCVAACWLGRVLLA